MGTVISINSNSCSNSIFLFYQLYIHWWVGIEVHCIVYTLLKRKGYFNNGLVTRVASLSFCTIVQLL